MASSAGQSVIDAQAGPRKSLGYAWDVIRHPSTTFTRLAAEPSLGIGFLPVVGYGGAAIIHGLVQHLVYGWGFLGTKPILADPTFVGGYGYLSLTREQWSSWAGMLFWILLMPLMWIVLAGGAQVVAHLFGGQGRFEQFSVFVR